MWTILKDLNLDWDTLEIKLNGNSLEVDLYKRNTRSVYLDYGHKLIFNQKIFYYKNLVIVTNPDNQIDVLEICL